MNLASILVPMATGLSLGLAYKWNKRKHMTDKNLFSQENADSVESIAKFCEFIALKVLLPFFIIDSLIKSSVSVDLLGVFIVGFLVPLICYWLAKTYTALTNNSVLSLDNPKELGFIVSTFGGGNRGMLFLLILFGASSSFEEYVKYFALLDLGNFIFLLVVIPALLNRAYKKKMAEREPFYRNYAIVSLFIVSIFFIARELVLQLLDYDLFTLIANTVDYRKPLLGVFIFCAITLRMVISKDLMKGFFFDIIGFFIVRFFAFLLIGSAVYFTNYPKYLTVVVGILLLMPPSSLYPGMLGQVTENKGPIQYTNTVSAAFNLFFLLFIITGFIVSIGLNIHA
jgi:hypothetical protein